VLSRVAEESVGTEGPLAAGAHGGDEVWRIVNPSLTNCLGQHPGYELRPDHSTTSPLRRTIRRSGAPAFRLQVYG
jgi:Cu2+-containing amine oxidase